MQTEGLAYLTFLSAVQHTNLADYRHYPSLSLEFCLPVALHYTENVRLLGHEHQTETPCHLANGAVFFKST